MNVNEESPVSTYELAEGGTMDQERLNQGARSVASNQIDGGDGLLNGFAVQAHQQRTYLWSAQFYELLVCLAYFFMTLSVIYGLQIQPTVRPMPYQVLENSGDYVRNLMYNEIFEGETVPFLALCFLSLWLPLGIQLGLSSRGIQKINDMHATGCAYLVAMATNTVATESIKLYVGYLRPTFYNLCQPDDTYQSCTSDEGGDIRKSFPSGHSSMSFCGLTLLTLFIHTRFGVPSQRYYHRVGGGTDEGRWVRETIQVAVGWTRFVSMLALLPVGLAIFIATSRLADNEHFPADVVGGSVLGASIAVYVHGLWFD